MENQSDSANVVAVAVDAPLHQTFDYRCEIPLPEPGSRVEVPFGRRKIIGFVWPKAEGPKAPLEKLRNVIRTVDAGPLIPRQVLELIGFAARYYHHPPGEVCAAALPAVLRQARDDSLLETRWHATEAGAGVDLCDLRKRAPRQAELLEALHEHGESFEHALDARIGNHWRRQRKTLHERGWIDCVRQLPEWSIAASPAQPGPELNAEQHSAVERVREIQGFGVALLDGVTGSGKTEVYLSLIEHALEQGKQTLVLVPEIGLTPQLASRLERRLGVKPMLYHSELNERERAHAWLAARSGDAPLLLATRSGVFLPLANPGLIVVDEEHDSSLKQHEGFRYHARDLAVWRARQSNIPIVLGSATPSLESLANARTGRYEHLRLTERAGDARPPRLSIIDMNRYNVIDGLAQPAIDAMRAHLEAGRQVLVYINRRGYAPTLICSACGHIADCEQCDAHMTVHRGSAQLQCHHCGSRRELPRACEQCGGALKPLGEGTERVEQALADVFGDYPMLRIDSDTTGGRDALGKALQDARDRKVSILVGTQMLAKGHHLPGVTLVVIVNLDQGFFASDLRASERLAQTLVQVAGRAGRVADDGEVLLQTAFPNHPLLATLATAGYSAFAEAALAERKLAQWPPFTHLAVLHAAARTEARAIGFLQSAAVGLGQTSIRVLGPAPATMLRRRNRFRYRLLLQTDSRAALQTTLGQLTAWLRSRREDQDVRWSLDIDPQQDI